VDYHSQLDPGRIVPPTHLELGERSNPRCHVATAFRQGKSRFNPADCDCANLNIYMTADKNDPRVIVGDSG